MPRCTLKAIPSQSSKTGTLACHVSKSSTILELAFHHFFTQWNFNFNHPIKIFIRTHIITHNLFFKSYKNYIFLPNKKKKNKKNILKR